MLYLRPPVAAGRFYDLDMVLLNRQIEIAFQRAGKNRKKIGKVRAAIVPHAGYEYSGHVAASVYSLLDRKKPTNFIIIGTNHYMVGSKYAIMKQGLWKTPLGGVAVDQNMVESIMKKCELLENDVLPHQNEHSIEVQIPMLQYVCGSEFKFVPISIGLDSYNQSNLDDLKLIGKSLASCVKSSKENWMILASSDFSHYISQKDAEAVDKYLLSPITRLNESSLFERAEETNTSACGIGAITASITAAKALGAKTGKIVKYSTSGEITGDKSSVVGYAGVVLQD